MAKIQHCSIDIYLNKPQSIRIIKIGFDYMFVHFYYLLVDPEFWFEFLLFASSIVLYFYGVFYAFLPFFSFRVFGTKLFVCM